MLQGQTHRWAIAWTYLPAAAFKADATALDGKQASACCQARARVTLDAYQVQWICAGSRHVGSAVLASTVGFKQHQLRAIKKSHPEKEVKQPSSAHDTVAKPKAAARTGKRAVPVGNPTQGRGRGQLPDVKRSKPEPLDPSEYMRQRCHA